MKIDVYSNMYNEEFILPYWLRHYETFADRIFVWDDGSTDSTRKILSEHPKITILPVEKHGDDDSYWTEALFPQAQKYSQGNADWVIIADADEFVYHPTLTEVLNKKKKEKVQLIQCAGYTMISEKPPKGSGQIYGEIKMGLPDKLESKWTIHSPEVNIRYPKGRHGRPHGFRNFKCDINSGIKLLHYRYLGEKYFEDHDRKNIERLKLAFPDKFANLTFESKRWHYRTCPDGKRHYIYKWYRQHKNEAFNVLDS